MCRHAGHRRIITCRDHVLILILPGIYMQTKSEKIMALYDDVAKKVMIKKCSGGISPHWNDKGKV